MQLKFVILFFVGVLAISAAPVKNTTKIALRQPIKKVGIVDVLTLIPGIHKNEICAMCKRILNAVKKDTLGRANFEQNDLRAFVDHECHVLTQNSIPYLPLESLEPFCREFGGSLMDFANTYANLMASFIEPGLHCERATFCVSTDDE